MSISILFCTKESCFLSIVEYYLTGLLLALLFEVAKGLKLRDVPRTLAT